MLTVASVLSPGPIYNDYHVERLKRMVSEHMEQPYRFVCVTDSPFPGWWSKVSLFQPNRFTGRVLYLDLDVTVIGKLDDLADYENPFALCQDWIPTRGLGKSKFNTSVMSWYAGDCDYLYNDFDEYFMKRLHGDQDWVSEHALNASYFPEQWCVSYKLQKAKLKTLPKDARVVVYHGQPKSWDLPENHLQQFNYV